MSAGPPEAASAGLPGEGRRALVLGCNANQVPYLRAARALGFCVVGTDRNPGAPGAAWVDRFHPVGYDDLDGLRALARAEGLGPEDRVFTASAHHAYEGAAVVAEQAGLSFPSRHAIHTALDKSRFYPAVERVGLRVPSTRLVPRDQTPTPDPERAYWLKSDYGKSPRYCWRVTGGRLPERPQRFDAFYRRCFLLQEEIDGRHLRVNLWAEQTAVFAREGDVWLARPDLGPGGHGVVAGLRRLVAGLGMAGWLTKFDLIERAGTYFVLDLGLDPPMRLRRACEARGIDFAAGYTALYLLGDASRLPAWERVRPGTAIRVPAGPTALGARGGGGPCA